MSDSKTVLITGASTGIGFATAGLFARQGWNVAATMRQPANAKPFDGPHRSDRIRPFKLDVTQPATIEATIADAEAAFGPIDAIVNNAGYGLVGPFEAMTGEQLRRQIDTNVIGVMNVCQAILPRFRERRRGTIINVASMGGRVTFPLYSVYHATKWAVEGFSEALVYETEGFGIRVKIIEPGAIKTDFYERSMDIAKRPGLTAYDAFVSRVMPKMQSFGATAPRARTRRRKHLQGGNRQFAQVAIPAEQRCHSQPAPVASRRSVPRRCSPCGWNVGAQCFQFLSDQAKVLVLRDCNRAGAH